MIGTKISPFKTYFDEIAETDGDDKCRAWLRRILDSKQDLVDFAGRCLKRGGNGAYVGFLKGSFNFSFRVSFRDGQDVIIRFPKPGHTAFREEKVTNEFRVMEYLRQNTTIPVPCVHRWGLTKESPRQLGPFIIMDLIDGTLLSTMLKQPDTPDLVLDPNVDNALLDKVYRQIAGFLLQLSELRFSKIGAISKEDHTSNTWHVVARPLTYDMNELATVAGYPGDQFPTEPFDRTSDYLTSVAKEHMTHLWIQRNIADNPEIARGRYVARRRLLHLIPKYCVDEAGPFIPFCDDMRPSNLLVDPETCRITAIIDFEFTNAMPAQFTYDPPWWLLLSGPEMWFDRCSAKEFLALYEPRMRQFLQALDQVEREEFGAAQPARPSLATRMRESWDTGRFWFDYAIRRSFDLDVVYWTALRRHDDDDDDDDDDDKLESSENEMRSEMDPFVKLKMEQLKAYNEECRVRFSSG
ncbi:hypothetical protein Z517_06154 [Fonsecaea pedrosoi CBS 271.37]|uniref:Aminoglycoside phosphotransferase domain-containing protein n=1 Tax=Fonsecaea pedrosoi CBS 271.37 TaxID=1442368 RepID=A0A0D2EZ25_9EURO|nr:uncharacterized protein Z517_06154 [Fonsecaea pedrosoi CBS 271.37]KIW79542.1 hypothetical protein Z517_06154 [Fonsecaea pedrosoi CBS 271.37]